jgi:hypothetical protein
MTTKKLFSIASLFLLIFFTFPAFANDVPVADPITNTIPVPAEPNPRVQVLVNRLTEIKSMDKSNMTRSEKKELRQEVRSIKKEMKGLDQRVYLSVGAIIIIILLLILIL